MARPRSVMGQINLRALFFDTAIAGSIWYWAALGASFAGRPTRAQSASLAMVLAASAVTITVGHRRGLYRRHPVLPRTEEVARVGTAIVSGAAAVALLAVVADWPVTPWEILAGAMATFLVRTLVQGCLRALASARHGDRPHRAVVVGTGAEAAQLVELIDDHPESRLSVVGVVGDLQVAQRHDLQHRWLGPTARVAELMRSSGATKAIVTATGFRGIQFQQISRDLFDAGHDVYLTAGVGRVGAGRFDIESLAHEPLVVMAHNPRYPFQLLVKRVIDLVGASVALVLAAPVMALTALAIWAEDRGPIVYTSVRTGHAGSLFRMYKFRSMVANAEALKAKMERDNERNGPLFKVSNDPRTTRIGRLIRQTSIDELPQLINVLKGDMSLVGPRPALPGEVATFDDELLERTDVKPGMTGLWQVEARTNAAFSAYRRLDLHYVENWSLTLDLKILLATVEQVLVSLAVLPLYPLLKGTTADEIEERTDAQGDGGYTPVNLGEIPTDLAQQQQAV